MGTGCAVGVGCNHMTSTKQTYSVPWRRSDLNLDHGEDYPIREGHKMSTVVQPFLKHKVNVTGHEILYQPPGQFMCCWQEMFHTGSNTVFINGQGFLPQVWLPWGSSHTSCTCAIMI